MDSSDLRKHGFGVWFPFRDEALPNVPESAGCYAFRSAAAVTLKRGSSDVQGRSASNKPSPYHNLRHCLREYLHPGRDQKTRLRVRAQAVRGGWQVSWFRTTASDRVECDLLRRFFAAHSQLPPENKEVAPKLSMSEQESWSQARDPQSVTEGLPSPREDIRTKWMLPAGVAFGPGRTIWQSPYRYQPGFGVFTMVLQEIHGGVKRWHLSEGRGRRSLDLMNLAK
jgi:hypothetical protein